MFGDVFSQKDYGGGQTDEINQINSGEKPQPGNQQISQQAHVWKHNRFSQFSSS